MKLFVAVVLALVGLAAAAELEHFRTRRAPQESGTADTRFLGGLGNLFGGNTNTNNVGSAGVGGGLGNLLGGNINTNNIASAGAGALAGAAVSSVLNQITNPCTGNRGATSSTSSRFLNPQQQQSFLFGAITGFAGAETAGLIAGRPCGR